MGVREIASIEKPNNSQGGAEAAKASPSDEVFVELNFTKPVPLSDVIAQVASWSDVKFVMDPALNKSIQIFAPRPMSRSDAFNLFVASLETVGLRAVMLDGNVAKIVAHGLGKVSV